MNCRMKGAVLAGLLAWGTAGADPATPVATVSFADPETFSDVAFFGPERERMMADLRAYVEKLAKRLPRGARLHLEFVDIDLAGRLEPMAFGQEVRVMTGRADFPRLELRYSVERDGKVTQSGKADLLDMTYLDRPERSLANEPLRYEKAMLDRWFKQTIKLD